MPHSFAPPQPKHSFAGFGANVIDVRRNSLTVSPRYSLLLHISTSLFRRFRPAPRGCVRHAARRARACAFRRLQQIGRALPRRARSASHLTLQSRGAAYLAAGLARKNNGPGAKRTPRSFDVNQKFAGVKARRQFEPEAHTAFGTRPARIFGHVFAQAPRRERAGARRRPCAFSRRAWRTGRGAEIPRTAACASWSVCRSVVCFTMRRRSIAAQEQRSSPRAGPGTRPSRSCRCE